MPLDPPYFSGIFDCCHWHHCRTERLFRPGLSIAIGYHMPALFPLGILDVCSNQQKQRVIPLGAGEGSKDG